MTPIVQSLPLELRLPIQTLFHMSDHAHKSRLYEASEMINAAIEKIKQVFRESDITSLTYFQKAATSAYGLKPRQLKNGQKSADISGCKALIIYFVKKNSQLTASELAAHFRISKRQAERLFKSIDDMLVHPNGNKRLFEKYNIIKNQFEKDYGKKN